MDKYFSRINQHIICLILCVAMFSCMGESGTIVKFGSQAGVVRLADGKQIHLRNGMTLEAQELDTLAVKDADCCLVDFQINYDTQTDTLQGIWHTDWLIYKPVPKWKQLMLTEPDTMIRADEHFLDFDIPKGGFVSNHLFLYMEYGSHYQTQVDSFRMSFLPAEGLVYTADSSRKVYRLYLRSFGSIAEKDSVTEQKVLPQAFDLTDFVEWAKTSPERTDDTIRFQVVYPKQFNSNYPGFVWNASEVYSVLENGEEVKEFFN